MSDKTFSLWHVKQKADDTLQWWWVVRPDNTLVKVESVWHGSVRSPASVRSLDRPRTKPAELIERNPRLHQAIVERTREECVRYYHFARSAA